jgi:endo-1,4-beta-D-glucanase Y
MTRLCVSASIFLVIINLCASAALLPLPSPLPSVSTSYDTILKKTWEGIKKRLIDPYEVSLVHRPRSEEPHDAVSEGVGYGLLLALYSNDQTYFNKIWDAGEQCMWDDNGKCYNWRVNREGKVMSGGSGPASDAEEDIALALIFADGLVKKNIWTAHKSPKGVDYAARAQIIINNIWNSLVEEGKFLRPGAMWGGKAFVNPGYFAPAFYRVFDEFETEPHAWTGLIDQCYLTLAASPGYTLGMVPDWMQPDGKYSGASQLGYNAYADGKAMYKDGIRILWRIATDYQWYNDPRARQFLQKALAFVKTPARANFYQMDGSLLAATDSFKLGNGVMRPRLEHSELTIGMWATAAMGAGGPDSAEAYSKELLKFYEGGDYWGKASDPNGEDTLHNEMYFEQFLAWFGASLISGVFTNLWDDLKDPNPLVAAAFKEPPQVDPFDIDANKAPLTVKAYFTKSVRWTVEVRHRDSIDAVMIFSGSGDSAILQWSGMSSTGKCMPQGPYKVSITARGMKIPFTKMVWLGRALDLKSGSRLIVDNFADGDLMPFFGSGWGSYTEQSDGKNGKTSIKRLDVASGETPPALHWAFRVDGSQQIGFNPYAALEWNCKTTGGNLNLTGLDTIVFSARSASTLPLSVYIVTSDISDYTYFQDSVTLSTQTKEYRLTVRNFKQRLNGSGRTLDLSKATAIRFQFQGTDGTENEIILEKMLFAGSLASLYTSPPEYIPADPSIGVRYRKADAAIDNVTVKRMANAVHITLPNTFESASTEIYSLTGQRVRKVMSANSRSVAWDFSGNDGRTVPAGSYIAVVKAGKQVYRLPVQYLP